MLWYIVWTPVILLFLVTALLLLFVKGLQLLDWLARRFRWLH
jgi:hypothetical protein